MDRGSIGIAYWLNDWFFYRSCVHGVPPHPSAYLMLHRAWKGHQVHLPLVANDRQP